MAQFSCVQRVISDSARSQFHPLSKDGAKWLRAFASDRQLFDGVAVQCYKSPQLTHPAVKFTFGKGMWQPDGRLQQAISEVNGTHRSWLVSNLINSPHTPKTLRVLLVLAITPLVTLSVMDAARELPYEMLEAYQQDTIHQLRCVLARPDAFPPKDPLEERFFKLDKLAEVQSAMKMRAIISDIA